RRAEATAPGQGQQSAARRTPAPLPEEGIFAATLDVGIARARIPSRLQAVELLFADVAQLCLELLHLLEDLAQLVGLVPVHLGVLLRPGKPAGLDVERVGHRRLRRGRYGPCQAEQERDGGECGPGRCQVHGELLFLRRVRAAVWSRPLTAGLRRPIPGARYVWPGSLCVLRPDRAPVPSRGRRGARSPSSPGRTAG